MLDIFVEQNIFKQGYNYIGAIDEAGRGPLAGPVVATCLIISPEFDLSKNKKLELINDSKKISAKVREKLYNIIFSEFEYIGIGTSDHISVDRNNISQAAFLAMKKAIGALKVKPDFLILDGKFPIPNISINQQAIIDGDAKVFSIAAASIIAKVTRDRIMMEMHDKYPQYGFDKHKGYGTKLHLEMLNKYGPCPIHRKTFARVKELV